jgi:hypothetical protein
VSGYYVARVRVLDQSLNQSTTSPTANFVVDTASPAVQVTSPPNNSVFTGGTGVQTFTVDASENLDLTHFTPAQIQLLQSNSSGSFTGTGVTNIPISSNISVTYLDSAAAGGNGGNGRERLSFTSQSPLANGLYQLTLIGTGGNGIRDIAGNSPTGGNVVITFAVFDPNNIHGVFVGAGFTTDPTAALGKRANPYPTIAAALKGASVGDRLEILPGVYPENVVMQPFVSLASAATTSTDATFVPGNALDTVIRAPAVASGVGNVTISATNLSSFFNPSTGIVFQPSISGLTIASSLVGDPALGPINTAGVGISVVNSSILIQQCNIIDTGTGILVQTSGNAPLAPQIINSGIIGNITGAILQDSGSATATTTKVINNTFAYNTVGLNALNSATTGSSQGYIANNIFWQNHDQTTARSGVGISSQNPDKLVLVANMFSGNGASDQNASGATSNIGTANGFNQNLLGPTASAAAANQGNYTGWPAFIAPRDPRPGSDGPATFLLDANFGLQATSAAINNAVASAAPTTDFLGNPQNPNPTTSGFHLPGYGPRDVGAFEFEPVGSVITKPIAGAFRVVTTSLVPSGGTQANGATLTVSTPPSSVIVSFSRPVDQSSVKPSALVLSGSDINPFSPVTPISVSWIDDHTAVFNLSGAVGSSGTLKVSLASGSIKSSTGAPIEGYADQVVISTQAVNPAPSPNPSPAPAPTPVTPPPASPPKGKKVPVKIKHPHPKPVVHRVTPKHPVAKPTKHTAHVAVPKHKLPTAKAKTSK